MTKWTRAKRLTTLGTALAVAMSMLAGPAAAADPPATAQDTRTTIIGEITSLLTGNEDADKKLTEAAKKLDESQNPKYWSRPDELSKEGNKVFEKDRDAAKKLREAVKKLTEADLTHWADAVNEILGALVDEDQSLATDMIEAAVAAGASGSKIEDARKEMAKAEKELADGKPHKAIDHFKKAWEKAFKAEAEAVKAAAKASTATASTSGGGDYAEYTFWFINTATGSEPFAVTGTNKSGTPGYTGRGNEGFIWVEGTQMQLHVSCSDAFTDGTGDKSDPTEASPYRVVNYTISKYKGGELAKTCNLTGVPDYASVSLEVDLRIDRFDGTLGDWNAGDTPPFPVADYYFDDTVTYRYTVTNSGSVDLSGISLTDGIVNGPAQLCVFAEPLAPGADAECITDPVAIDYVGLGDRPYGAAVTATDPGGTTVSADDEATFTTVGE